MKQTLMRWFGGCLNGCLSKTEYADIQPLIRARNGKTLQWFSGMYCTVMTVLLLLSLVADLTAVTSNRLIYAAFALSSLPIFILSRFYVPRHLKTALPLYYALLTLALAFGIIIGIRGSRNMEATTICAIVLAVPLLIVDRPYRIDILQITASAVFCVLSWRFKSEYVFELDMTNIISLLLLSIAINTKQQNERFQSFRNQCEIERQHESQMKKKEVQIVESHIAIMLSQIQPHLLYNALGVIQDMCHGKAPDAEQATIEFSEFLRGNLDSIRTQEPIPFERELRHTQNYLFLEQKRFGNRLRVIYHLESCDFQIPPLTLQPIVENAVRYGVMPREEGGTVVIESREDPAGYRVTVMDDGLGFDIHQKKTDGRTHIGIENVGERLRLMSSGTLTINSKPGEGTIAVIFIPKGEKTDHGKDSGNG